MAEFVHLDRARRQAFGEADRFLQRLRHLLVVQRVGRAVDQPAAVGDGGAAPLIEQLRQPRRPALPRRRRTFGRDRRGVARNSSAMPASSAFQRGAHRSLAALRHQRAVAGRELLHLADVVGEAFGRGIDRGQAAADHHHRQPQLQIGDRRQLRRAGELQRHQEVRRRAHAARQAVRDVEHGRLAGPHAQRDVVEAHRPGIVHADRGAAAEADAAEMRELRRAAPAAGAPASGSSCSTAR